MKTAHIQKTIKIKSVFNFFNLKYHLCVLFLFVPNFISAQNNTSAFETFSLGINYQSNINRNDFHNYWLADGGIEGYFSTPFYFGQTQFVLIYTSYSAKSDEQPDFTSLLIYLQWGYEFNLPANLSLAFYTSAGLYQMNFDDFDLEVDPGLLSERELSMGLNTTMRYTFYNDGKVNFQLSYLHVFTHKKIELINLGFGISRTFSSPKWLKDFFN